jgi:hypothetical protein
MMAADALQPAFRGGSAAARVDHQARDRRPAYDRRSVATATEALTRAAMRADDRVRLGLVVGVAFVLLALLALGAPGPRIFPDEIIYMDAAASVAGGDGLSVRGGDYGYGPLYPILVAPLVWLGGDRETAFVLAQLLNALAFALTAVPVFLLARRVAGPGLALVAAVLSILVPSSVYAAGVLTESVAYLAFAGALLAVVRAVEEPSVTRQLVALGSIGVAGSIRTQFLVLVPVLAATLIWAALLLPGGARPAWRLWPTAAVLAGGLVAVLALLAGGRSAADLLGSYGVLWESYDVGDLARWFVDHLGLLVLYVAVVPAVVAPVELARWWREARRGSRSHAGLVTLFGAANLGVIAVVAAFASTPYAVSGLHDRSMFYVAPLWFVAFAGWLDSGMARPVAGIAVGAVGALLLVAQLPYHFVDDILWEMLAFEPWQFVERGNPAGTPFSGREAMLGWVLVGILAAAFVPRASRWAIVALAGAMLAFTGSLAWAHGREGARSVEETALVAAERKNWVDAAVPAGADVLLLRVPSACRDDVALSAQRVTEFFNDSLGPGASIGPSDRLAPPSTPAAFRDGALVSTETGAPLAARYVVVREGVVLDGTRMVAGTQAPLAVWDVGGAVRLARPIRGLPCA